MCNGHGELDTIVTLAQCECSIPVTWRSVDRAWRHESYVLCLANVIVNTSYGALFTKTLLLFFSCIFSRSITIIATILYTACV